MSVWQAWALSSRGLVLVICLPVCLSQQPQVNPPDCSRREHPVVTYQGETIDTFSYIDPSVERKLKLADVQFPLTDSFLHILALHFFKYLLILLLCQALRPWVSEFSHPGVKDFSQLALDLNRHQLIVGAR